MKILLCRKGLKFRPDCSTGGGSGRFLGAIAYHNMKGIDMTTQPPIIIIVSGGVVQDIRNIPEGITLEVHDYDSADEIGSPCEIAKWTNESLGQ